MRADCPAPGLPQQGFLQAAYAQALHPPRWAQHQQGQAETRQHAAQQQNAQGQFGLLRQPVHLDGLRVVIAKGSAEADGGQQNQNQEETQHGLRRRPNRPARAILCPA